jgi:hypothetical protein
MSTNKTNNKNVTTPALIQNVFGFFVIAVVMGSIVDLQIAPITTMIKITSNIFLNVFITV